MKFCSKCGNEIVEEAVVCPHCGCAVAEEKQDDAPSIGFAVLGFFLPLVGLILYLIWKDKTPKKAKSAGKGALIGFCVNIVITVIYSILLGSLLGSMLSIMY